MRQFWLGLGTGMTISGTYHLIATTTPAQVVDNAHAWLAWIGAAA